MTAELVCAASDPAWLDRRREGVTATDIVTIAGLVTWDSPWALYHRKLGLLPEVEQSDRMRLGSWLEAAIRAEWFEAHPSGDMERSGLYRSAARLWQLATPDAVVSHWEYDPPLRPAELFSGVRMSGLLGGEPKGHRVNDAVLECKTSATRQGWGDDGSDVVPAHVRAQVLWQMDTLGVPVGHVAVVFLPSGEFRSYTIRHDWPLGRLDVGNCAVCDEVDGLRDLGFGFWSRILTRRPPDLDGLEVTTDALRYLHPAPIDTPEPIEPYLVRDYDAAAIVRREADIRYREIQNKIREAMGDATTATAHGAVVFRRTIGKRAGYTVPPGETDQLRRIGKDKDSGTETA